MFEDWAFHDVSPLYIQLIDKIEPAIYIREFTAGQAFPSCRATATAIHFNPNTVSRAYRILKGNQMIVIIKGRYFVNPDVNIIQTKKEKAVHTLCCPYLALMKELGFTINEVLLELRKYMNKLPEIRDT